MAKNDKKRDGAARSAPGDTPRQPDPVSGLWTAWQEQLSGMAGPGNPMMPASTATPFGLADGGIEAMEATILKDPTVRALAEMWNANPVSKVVPVDWAEVAGALRTVWLRSLGRPRPPCR